jgi:uncharacterized membrane protein YhdT
MAYMLLRRKVLDSTTNWFSLVSLVESPAVFVLVSHNLVNHVFNTILLLCKTTRYIDSILPRETIKGSDSA